MIKGDLATSEPMFAILLLVTLLAAGASVQSILIWSLLRRVHMLESRTFPLSTNAIAQHGQQLATIETYLNINKK